MKLRSPPEFFTMNCLTNSYLSCDPYFVILAWVQNWNIFEKHMKLRSPPEFFTINCLTNNYLSCDPYFVILAGVQSWSIFEKFMKVSSPPEFFHKNVSHEQLRFTWFTFRDSSMGTKLKYFWKTHETVKSARKFSQGNFHKKYVAWTITFDLIHLSWLSMGTKLK